MRLAAHAARRRRFGFAPRESSSADFFTRRLAPEGETRRLIAKLEALGHQVSLQPAADSPSTASAYSALGRGSG
jgi:hypothetical protein